MAGLYADNLHPPPTGDDEMTAKKKKWVMPKWMDPYRENMIYGSRAEELMNANPNNANVIVNAPLALICVGCESEVGMLTRLHNAGKLAPPETTP